MPTPKERATLRAAILATFAGNECPPQEDIALHECDECAELRAAFAGVQWDAMPTALIEAHENSLPLLAPAAFAYFLPAYLLYGLDHMTWRDDATEYTVYAVAPDAPENDDHADWQRERFKPITAAQVAVIDQWLDLVERSDLGSHIRDVAERRTRFHELWNSRWSA